MSLSEMVLFKNNKSYPICFSPDVLIVEIINALLLSDKINYKGFKESLIIY